MPLSEDLEHLATWCRTFGPGLTADELSRRIAGVLSVCSDEARNLECQIVPEATRTNIVESDNVVRFELARRRRNGLAPAEALPCDTEPGGAA